MLGSVSRTQHFEENDFERVDENHFERYDLKDFEKVAGRTCLRKVDVNEQKSEIIIFQEGR